MMRTAFLAYLDAGSTSLLLAAIASGAAGLRFFIKSKLSKFRRSGEGSGAAPVADPTSDGAG